MKNKIKVISILLAVIFILNSCLKDDHDYWSADVKGKMYATVLVPTMQSLTMQPVPDTVSYSFMVNIATDKLPTEDITVTVAIDGAALDAYNKTNSTLYKLFPNILIENPTITISKGTRTAYIKVDVWGADKLNACDNYVSPITITTVSDSKVTIASNMKTSFMSLPINNPYAGTYHCFGYRIRPGNAPEPVDADEDLTTVDCKTVIKTGFGNYSSYQVQIEVTSDVITVDGTACNKVNATVIDPSTGSTVGGMWPTWTGDASMSPAKPADNSWINYYNPVAKVFVLNCYYVSTANRIMYEVLTRK